MARYRIIQAEPGTYREEIIRFWELYLPGTASGRFDWMNSGNPAGPSIWFLAFDDKAGELSGTISVMLRDLVYRNTNIRAGILGDFMVRGTDRVFGPGLMLPRAVVSRMGELGLDLLYTVPNHDSRKIIEKSGFTRCLTLKSLVMPVTTEHYLSKYMNETMARYLAPVSDAALRILTASFKQGVSTKIREEKWADESFDALWAVVRSRGHMLMGERGSAYLNWRYFLNPRCDYRLIACRNKRGELLGYIFFSMDSGKVHIHDIVALEKSHVRDMIRELNSWTVNNGCHGIEIQFADKILLLPWLNRFFFFDAKGDIDVYAVAPGEGIDVSQWNFFSGDRNI